MFTRPADRPGLFLLPEPVSIIKLFFLIVGLQRHVGDFPGRWGEGSLLNPSLPLHRGRTARGGGRRPAGGRQVPGQPQPSREAQGTRAEASRAPGRTGRRLHLRRRFRRGGGGRSVADFRFARPGPRRYSAWGRGRELLRPGKVKVLRKSGDARGDCVPPPSRSRNQSTLLRGSLRRGVARPQDGGTGQWRQATPLTA